MWPEYLKFILFSYWSSSKPTITTPQYNLALGIKTKNIHSFSSQNFTSKKI